MARLLVVEDDHSIRHLVTTILRHAGHQIIAVLNGQAALEILDDDDQFDGVVTDLQMPILDGEHLIDILQNDFPHLPIICMSASDERLEAMKSKGIAYTLWKPFSRQQLLEAVAGILTDDGAYMRV